MLWLKIFRIIKVNVDVLKNSYLKNKYSGISNYLIHLDKTLHILIFSFLYIKIQINNKRNN